MSPRHFAFVLNLWGIFRVMRIRVRHISPDWREIDVDMRLGFFNRNYMGSHFGGSLFSMTDPFFWLIVQRALGEDYIVSHKGGRIDFLTPGFGKVRAHFSVPDALLNEIRAQTAGGDRHIPELTAEILDESDTVIARATQILHIRKRMPQ